MCRSRCILAYVQSMSLSLDSQPTFALSKCIKGRSPLSKSLSACIHRLTLHVVNLMCTNLVWSASPLHQRLSIA